MSVTLKTVTCTIPAGSSMSSDADCRGSIRILRVLMPPAWTRAPLTFRLSSDQVDWGDLYHTVPDDFEPFEVLVPEVIPGSVVTLPVNMSATVAFVRVRSGARASQVPQAEARVFKFVLEMPEALPPGPTGATGPAGPPGASGATGPTAGWQRIGNVLNCWGTVVATTGSGVQVTFPQPYVDDNPIITTGGQAGGVLQVTAISRTGFTITCNSGTPMVYWRAVGS